MVQALLSSQLAGHEPGGSQVSPVSTMPLPQLDAPVPPVELPEPAEAPPVAGGFEVLALSEHDDAATPKMGTKSVNRAFFMRAFQIAGAGRSLLAITPS